MSFAVAQAKGAVEIPGWIRDVSEKADDLRKSVRIIEEGFNEGSSDIPESKDDVETGPKDEDDEEENEDGNEPSGSGGDVNLGLSLDDEVVAPRRQKSFQERTGADRSPMPY